MDLISTPGRIAAAAVSLASRMLCGGLTALRRLPRALVDDPADATQTSTEAVAIGSNPNRRYGSASSRTLAAKR